MCADLRSWPASKAFLAACFAPLLLVTVACGSVGSTAGALSDAVDARSQEVEEGADASVADLLFALLSVGLEAGDGAEASHEATLAHDPHDHSAVDGEVVDEPLAPRAAGEDRRDLVSGTSPDPAPEIGTGSEASECEDGYALFQGECLPQEVVEGLLALGLDPNGDPSR